MVTNRADYDSPWKEILERFFPQFLLFFFPDIYRDIDWDRPPEFLESELQQITKGAATGRRRVDKLVRVYLKSGAEQWLLIHVEVQAQPEPEFPERVYIYNYRIYDIFRRPVASLAVLTDDRSSWRPSSFHYTQWNVRAGLDFRTVKLLDWQADWSQLEQDLNPFAIVIMAHLKTLETRGSPLDRSAWKWSVTRMLYERGYSREEIINLFRFIDWIMVLPEGLEESFQSQLQAYEEERRMQYISTIERRAIERGLEEGLQKGRQKGLQEGRQKGLQEGRQKGLQEALRKAVMEVLEERFGPLSEEVETLLAQVGEPAQLERILRWAVRVESVDAFTGTVAEFLAESAE